MVAEKNLFFSKNFFKSRKNHVFCTLNFYYTIYFRANSIRNCFLYVTKYRNGDFYYIQGWVFRPFFFLDILIHRVSARRGTVQTVDEGK